MPGIKQGIIISLDLFFREYAPEPVPVFLLFNGERNFTKQIQGLSAHICLETEAIALFKEVGGQVELPVILRFSVEIEDVEDFRNRKFYGILHKQCIYIANTPGWIAEGKHHIRFLSVTIGQR